MPVQRTRSQGFPQPIDYLLSVLVLALLLLGTTLYVTHERAFYFYDTATYYNLAIEHTERFSRSPGEGIYRVLTSLMGEYNALLVVPLLPVLLAFGTSRLTYELSLTALYAFPLLLMFGFIGAQLVADKRRLAFWITVGIGLATPAIWVPTLRGYPDVGAALPITLATLVFLRDTALSQRKQRATIGVLLALSIILRRHFAYAGIAFLVAGYVTMLLMQFRGFRGTQTRLYVGALRSATRLINVAAVCLLTIAVVDLPLLYRILFVNYYSLYASYLQPVPTMVSWVLTVFGAVTFALSVAGYALALRRKLLVPAAACFIVLNGTFMLLVWVLIVRQVGAHFALHLSPLVIFGLLALVRSWQGSTAQAIRAAALALGLFLQLVVTLMPLPVVLVSAPTLPRAQPPMAREDLAELASLVGYLRQEAGDRRTYVAASSDLLNVDLLANAEQTIYGPARAILQLVPPADVDSRDRDRLPNLIDADLVIVTDPPQQHLPSAQQKAITAIGALFADGSPFAQDFVADPTTFTLGTPPSARPPGGMAPVGQATVTIYRRTRPTPPEIGTRTLFELESAIYGSPR